MYAKGLGEWINIEQLSIKFQNEVCVCSGYFKVLVYFGQVQVRNG